MKRRYRNLDGTVPEKGLGDMLKWQVVDTLAGRRTVDPGRFVTPRRDNDGRVVSASHPHVTWIGHSSLLLRLGGALIATDPVFAKRMGPRRRLVGRASRPTGFLPSTS